MSVLRQPQRHAAQIYAIWAFVFAQFCCGDPIVETNDVAFCLLSIAYCLFAVAYAHGMGRARDRVPGNCRARPGTKIHGRRILASLCSLQTIAQNTHRNIEKGYSIDTQYDWSLIANTIRHIVMNLNKR